MKRSKAEPRPEVPAPALPTAGQEGELRREIEALRTALRQSEELLSIAPAFFGFLSRDGAVLAVNDLAVQVVQATREQIVGKPFWECPWWAPLPASAQRIRASVLEAAGGQGSKYDIEYCAVQDGAEQRRWVVLSLTPLFDGSSHVVRIAATGVDITEQQAMQEALRRSEDRLWDAAQAAEEAKNRLHEDERRLRRIVEVTQVGAWELDLEAQEFEVDSAFCKLFGIPPTRRLTLDQRMSLLHPEDRERISTATADALAGKNGGFYVVDYRTAVLADGEFRWIEGRGQVTFGKQHEAVRFLGTVRDITERKAAEEALRAESERRRIVESLLETSSDLIAFTDSKANVLYLNPTGRRLVGVDRLSEARTFRLTDYFNQDVESKAMEHLLDGHPWSGQLTIRNLKTGRKIPVRCVATALTDEAGGVAGLLAIMRDPTAFDERN